MSYSQGFKCKFSHDLAVERKSAKIDLFTDRRAEANNETMEDWDQEKLEAAIAEKHGSTNKNRPTEIICKHFLDAIEKKQYGFFWVCPGGGDECKYRHALPPGYVLKSQIKALAAEAAANKKTVEEEIEEARAHIKASTPVTDAVFQAWKRRKTAAAAAAAQQRLDERIKSGRLSGRELTEVGGFTFEDDVDAGEASSYAREDDVEAVFAAAAEQARAAMAAAAAAPADYAGGVEEALHEVGEEAELDDDELEALEARLGEAQLDSDGEEEEGEEGDSGGEEEEEDEDEDG